MSAAMPARAKVAATRTAVSPLIVVTKSPFNAEMPLADQIGLITPNDRFYVRTHFPIPRIDATSWRLQIDGEVHRPYQLTFDELQSLPSRSFLATLECAGNGRSAMKPPAEGEPWGYGAVSTAEWTGVSLRDVLDKAGPNARASEVVMTGADHGKVAEINQQIPFARGLRLDRALDRDIILAYAMNGSLLSPEHGYPVRLLVPGWYGMASVKWIDRIEVIADRFAGFYQTNHYVMEHPKHGETTKTPLTTTRVRSLILTPSDGATLSVGDHLIRGVAWSGAAPVTRVEVCVDGEKWDSAQFASSPECYAWRRWEYPWHARAPGQVALRSRAIDASGNIQPDLPEWNRLGYANNAVQTVSVRIA
jgi:DMSO/TMAO reductase YedYZ molybdopterin-dependent catalytic subunit